MRDFGRFASLLQLGGMERDHFCDFIAVLGDAEDLVARRLVRHPLGFLHAALWTAGAETLRLHVWPRHGERRRAEWPVHDHMWHLASVLLVGQLTNILYSVSDAAPAPERRLFEVHYDGQRNDLVPTGRLVAVNEFCRTVYAAGEMYQVESGQFHETVVAEDVFVATLVLASTVRERPPLVVADQTTGVNASERTPLNEEDARRVVETLRDAMLMQWRCGAG
jgi:hypothetical protein